MHLETSADGVAVALNQLTRSLDALYWERVKHLTKRGDLFPLRNANSEIHQKLAELVGSGRYSPLQIRALQSAFQSWTPPTMEEEANA